MMSSLVASWSVRSSSRPARFLRNGSSARRPEIRSCPRVRSRAVESLLLLALAMVGSARGGEEVHRLHNSHQGGETMVRVFTPDQPGPAGPPTILYVLPVEAGEGTRWGDPAEEVRRTDLAGRHGLIVAIPTFFDLPWYADHPSDPQLRQESYMLKEVLPLVERLHAAAPAPPNRFLVGFSKSGWGAWSLLLRHPELFSRAAAWDAPLMQEAPDRYGMERIFGDRANFERYRIARLVRDRADLLRPESRLILTGYYDSFRKHHVAMHSLLTGLDIPHVYRDGPKRAHNWHSGWLAETVALMVNP